VLGTRFTVLLRCLLALKPNDSVSKFFVAPACTGNCCVTKKKKEESREKGKTHLHLRDLWAWSFCFALFSGSYAIKEEKEEEKGDKVFYLNK